MTLDLRAPSRRQNLRSLEVFEEARSGPWLVNADFISDAGTGYSAVGPLRPDAPSPTRAVSVEFCRLDSACWLHNG